MADLPQFLTREANVDALENYELALRRLFFALVAAVTVVALFNVFGQSPSGTTAEAAAADLEVSAPTGLRGGIYFQGRFTVQAHRELERATLVLDPGWMESIHINTIEPAPIGEGSRDGKLVLELGRVPAGQKHVLYMQFQVNPTNVGRRSQKVELYDGDDFVAATTRTVTIFP